MRLILWLKIPWRTFINYKPSEQLWSPVFDIIQQGNEKGTHKVGLHGHSVARQAPLSILQARVLEWIAMPSSRGSSQPRDQTQVSHIAGRFLTNWATREAQEYWSG